MSSDIGSVSDSKIDASFQNHNENRKFAITAALSGLLALARLSCLCVNHVVFLSLCKQQKTQWLQMENMKNLGDLGFSSKHCCPQSPGTIGLVYRLEG